MAKLVNVLLVVAFGVVVCASVFNVVSGARETKNNDNSPARAPPVNPLPKHCRITGSCGDFLTTLVLSKTMPSEKDVVCCREIIQSTKYCWDTIMNILEDPTIPAFAHLHPWADNAWDKCVSITNPPPAQAPISAEVPALPEQCKVSIHCGKTLLVLTVTKTLPGEKDVMCCQEIVQNTKDCWEKAMDMIEDPEIPLLADLHPWAENAWSKCVSLTNPPAPAQAPLIGDSPAQAPATLPEHCVISESCANTLEELLVSKNMPTKKDVSCCREIIKTTKDCWEKTMNIIEDPKVPALAHLHPWAEDAWNRCVSLTSLNN